MFARVNAIFNTCGVILHEGRTGGLSGKIENQIEADTNIKSLLIVISS